MPPCGDSWHVEKTPTSCSEAHISKHVLAAPLSLPAHPIPNQPIPNPTKPDKYTWVKFIEKCPPPPPRPTCLNAWRLVGGTVWGRIRRYGHVEEGISFRVGTASPSTPTPTSNLHIICRCQLHPLQHQPWLPATMFLAILVMDSTSETVPPS